jgi:4'-phosphopantetheinyl transferase
VAAGKPAALDACGLEFNVTHSGERAAVAVTFGCPIGIDREQRRPVTEMDSIVRRYFCEEEAAAILGLTEDERERAFFCCWTRKEAYMKATGGGMGIPLHAFEVTVDPHRPARLVRVQNNQAEAAAWTLRDLDLHPQDAAALAYRDSERPLSILAVKDAEDFLPAEVSRRGPGGSL